MEIAALVSGGVDSSVVVHQLKEAGYDPTIFYIRIGMEDKDGYIDCPAEEDIEITSYIARKYGCRFEIVPTRRVLGSGGKLYDRICQTRSYP
jgi:tRNA U34 2-thiouridine synthase MnmA/TrmU